jgi:hypothetical protein
MSARAPERAFGYIIHDRLLGGRFLAGIAGNLSRASDQVKSIFDDERNKIF